MNRNKKAFSLVEISIVLIALAALLTIVINSSVILNNARIAAARNITKSAPVREITGLTLWLDAVSKESFDDEDIDDGDEITNWNDIKNSYTPNYVATQGVSTQRPKYDEDDINKLPGVKYDGANDGLFIADFAANAHMTLFVVGKFNSSNFFIEHSPTTDSNEGFYFFGIGNSISRIRRTADSSGGLSANWFGDDAAIGVMRYDGTDLSFLLNDGDFNINGVSLANFAVTDTLNIGSRNNETDTTPALASNGSFGEIIMYDRDLTDDEVDRIVDYLNTKWKIY